MGVFKEASSNFIFIFLLNKAGKVYENLFAHVQKVWIVCIPDSIQYTSFTVYRDRIFKL